MVLQLLFLILSTLRIGAIPFNFLTLANLSQSEYKLRPAYPGDAQYYESLCSRLMGLNPIQKEMCVKNPMSIPFVARGVREAIYECQQHFKYERWNCSDRYEITPTAQGHFHDILGRTIRSSTKEAAFLAAIASAGILHSVTKGCNTGNLSDCGCDSKPAMQRYTETTPIQGRQFQQFSWGGCSDNVPYGVKFARRFLDEFEKNQFEGDKNVSHLVMIHNHFVGREAIAQNMRKTCKCHGVSGSCEYKTCWLQMPKFSEVAEILKKRYDHFAVQVTKRAKKRLRRKERSERQTPLRGNEMAYVHRSPSYCEQNNIEGILGTTGRECNNSLISSQSCDLMCCGRGYNTRMEQRKEQCDCTFIWCCQVKCKECIRDVEVQTSVAAVFCYEKTFTAKGTLTCKGKPLNNQRVEIKNYEKVVKGSVLGQTTTDERGEFTIEAKNDTTNFSTNDMKVYIQIEHTCDANKDGCEVVTTIDIPADMEDKVFLTNSVELSAKENQHFNSCDTDDY